MGQAWRVVFLIGLLWQASAPIGDSASQPAARSKRERLLDLYSSEADRYSICHDATRRERVEPARACLRLDQRVRGGRRVRCGFRLDVLRAGRSGWHLFFISRSRQAQALPRISFAVARDPRRESVRAEFLDSRGTRHRADSDRGGPHPRALPPGD